MYNINLILDLYSNWIALPIDLLNDIEINTYIDIHLIIENLQTDLFKLYIIIFLIRKIIFFNISIVLYLFYIYFYKNCIMYILR